MRTSLCPAERPRRAETTRDTVVQGEPGSDAGTGCLDLSVIIPVHNAERWLADQLRALQRQDFVGSWELIVVDNLSSDRSAAIALAFAGRLPLTVVPADERAGAAYARNVGARAASGRFLAFCDADDIVDRGWLSGLAMAVEKYDVVAGAIDARMLNPVDMLSARGRQHRDVELADGPAHFLPYAPSGNLAIRRELMANLGGWPEDLRHCEDVEFSWRAQLAGYEIGFAGDAVVNYRFRTSIVDFYRQTVNYKRSEVELYRRYRDRGASRRTWREVARSVYWILTRLPYLVMTRRRRYVWVAVFASQVGRTLGSVRCRVFYP